MLENTESLSLVDWADLAIVDLSRAQTPEGRAGLAKDVCDAMTTKGFLYVIGHGYTEEEVSVVERICFG